MGKIKSKIENFFYYYKWHTLIIVFFTVMIGIMIAQSVSKPKYDVRVLYAGPTILSDEHCREIENAFSQLITEDFDGNGKKSAELFDLIIMDKKELDEVHEQGINKSFFNEEDIKQNRETLSLNVMAGEYIVYILDTRYYNELKKANDGIFADLDELGINAGVRYDSSSIYLSTLDFAKFYNTFDSFPFETVICLKKVTETKKRNSKLEKSYEYHEDYFKALTEFTLPEDFSE